MNEKLLPCPFCGGEAEIKEDSFMNESCYDVECNNCHCLITRHLEEQAIKVWNTRS